MMNIVRPLLYKYIVKMGLDTNQNKKIFFNTYLSSLWNTIKTMYRGIPSVGERDTVLDELHCNKFVQRGKEYLEACDLFKQAHLGLPIFYKNNNRKMKTYMSLYLLVVKALRVAKTTLCKHIK